MLITSPICWLCERCSDEQGLLPLSFAGRAKAVACAGERCVRKAKELTKEYATKSSSSGSCWAKTSDQGSGFQQLFLPSLCLQMQLLLGQNQPGFKVGQS